MLTEIENDLIALKTELEILKSYVKLGKSALLNTTALIHMAQNLPI